MNIDPRGAGASKVSRLSAPEFSARNVLALVFAGALIASCFKYTGLDVVGIDDSVYRTAVREWWRGGNPYATGLDANLAGTPFTYPPFALLLMSPLGWLGYVAVHNTMTLLTATGVAIMSFTVAHAIFRPVETKGWWRWFAACVLVAGALRSGNAVLSALSLGQVSIIVMALCLTDVVLLRHTRAFGVLIAIAAAVKVTPALFIVFLFAFDRRAGTRALVCATLFTLLPVLVLPSATWRYFTDYLWNTDRVGDAARNANVSMTGVMARSGVGPAGELWSWITFSAFIIAVSFLAVRRVWNYDSGVWAASIIGQVTCLVSPVTWSHHAAWFSLSGALLLVYGLLLRRGGWLVRVALAAVGAVIIYALYSWALLWSLPGAPTTGVHGFAVQSVFFLVGFSGLVGLWTVAFSHSLQASQGLSVGLRRESRA